MNFNVCNRSEYFQQLIEHANKASEGDRIVVATMSFNQTDRLVAKVLEALCEAAKRGASVRVLVDAYEFIAIGGMIPGPLFFGGSLDKRMPKYFSRKIIPLEKLVANGGEYVITNKPLKPFSNASAGRSHIKFAVVNDLVYVGGCNLKLASELDLMVYWEQKTIADWLYTLTKDVQKQKRVYDVLEGRDIELPVDEQSTLLVDAGKKKQSLILKNALRIIDEADDFVVMTCQYYPYGKVLEHLAQAVDRGVTVRLMFNDPSKHVFPKCLAHIIVKHYEKIKYPSILFAHELSRKNAYLHAKLLATEKSCILGSNNFIDAGVNFGTAEIALLSKNQEFAKRAIQKIDEQIIK